MQKLKLLTHVKHLFTTIEYFFVYFEAQSNILSKNYYIQNILVLTFNSSIILKCVTRKN